MRNSPIQFLSRFIMIVVSAAFAFLSPATVHGQTIKILHNFGVAPDDGSEPYGPLLKDSAGNFYGTTSGGNGAAGFGTVFRLSPESNGEYNETILYSFRGGSEDGSGPHAPLFRDSAGNLYSTTDVGGNTSSLCNFDAPECGVVYKLSPKPATGCPSGSNPGDGWCETVLFKFTGADGGNPISGLVRDSAGNFYGATASGGSKGLGTVYKLSLTSTGWKETVLHSFTGGADGAVPYNSSANLALDSLGNLYGSTYQGGAANAGTVFKLSPPTATKPTWTEKILYTFKGGTDGSRALGGVILDKSGNVYGTTYFGGPTGVNGGTVFKLTAADAYAKTVLHNFSAFTDKAKDFPVALIFDASGNLWGVTNYALFKLTPESNGWTESVFWDWDSTQVQNGLEVWVPPLIDANGHAWGVTLWGGQAGSTTGGVAWEVIP